MVGVSEFLLNNQNVVSMEIVICRRSLSGWLLSIEFKELEVEKFIPSPEMLKFYVIPDYDLSWYTDQRGQQNILFSYNQLLRLYASSSE